MEHKTVLQITGMNCHKYGAMERYLLQTAHYCKQIGIRTTIQYEERPESNAYIHDLEIAGVQMIYRPVGSNLLTSFLSLSATFAKVRPHVVHVHFANNYVRIMVPLLAKLFGAKRTIYMVHNKPSDGKPWYDRASYNLYEYVLCVSDAVRETLLRAGVKDSILRTHYLGIFQNENGFRHLATRNEIRRAFDIPESAVLLACIGFDDLVKGFDILLQSLCEIQKNNDLVYLLVVGVDPRVSKLPALADELKVAKKVRWVGIIDDGCQLLKGADLYVQPSRSEGLPLAIMEAMSLRLPIVCTRVSGNVEAVLDGETGFVVEPEPQSLSQGILRMIDNQCKWPKMGESAYHRFNSLFNGANSVQSMVQRYYV